MVYPDRISNRPTLDNALQRFFSLLSSSVQLLVRERSGSLQADSSGFYTLATSCCSSLSTVFYYGVRRTCVDC